MKEELHPESFFVVGGTLHLEAPSYIKRSADEELLRLILAGEYCNVLTARQMGKSSLMVRTADHLHAQGVSTAIIDLTTIGNEVSASEWYFGLVTKLTRQLNLPIDEQQWWQSQSESGPVQRFNEFLRNVVLEKTSEPIAIFIDEVDSTLKLRFTDDFFATIRAIYNARATDPVYRRITFVLLGVARPADLIKDRTRTPYNIGISIDVTDFRFEELASFQKVLENAYPNHGEEILRWILDWTGGQPYLTQKISAEIVNKRDGELTQNKLNAIVERLFLSEEAPNDTNLRAIPDRVKHSAHTAKMLRTYRKLLRGQRIVSKERLIEQNELKLAGLICVTSEGTLAVKNQLYARVFDESWVKTNAPTERAVIIAGIGIATTILLSIALVVNLINQQNQTVKIQTFAQGFENSDDPEIRLTNLAGLFGLGDQYTQQARDLFFKLTPQNRLALFKLDTPQNAGNSLVTVIEGVYQHLQNTSQDNELLKAMSSVLGQVAANGASSLKTEIEFWLQGRQLADKNQYEYDAVISVYTTALRESEQRKHINAGIYFDRANVYTSLKEYDAALEDFDTVVGLDKDRQSAVVNKILNEPNLMTHWATQMNKYPDLNAILLTLTSDPTPVPTAPTSTPKPTDIPVLTPTLVPTTSTSTPKPTDIPIFIPTLTPTMPPPLSANTALAIQLSTIFVSPNTTASSLGFVNSGIQVILLGRSSTGQWLCIRTQLGVTGYVYAPRFQITGDFATLPVVNCSVAGGATQNPSTPTKLGTPSVSLSMDIWDLPETAYCKGGKWYKTVYIRGQGGTGQYTYYWNDVKLAGPTSEGYTFQVSSFSGALIGKARILSGDGQQIEKNFYISAGPACQ